MSEILQEIVIRYGDNHPALAQYVGLSRSYGKSAKLSKSAIADRMKEVRHDLETVRKMKDEYLTLRKIGKIRLFEYKLVESKLESEIFELTELKEFETSIFPYFESLMSINYVYTARSYAHIDERIKHIITTEREIPRLLNEALDNLDKILPRDKLQVGLMSLKGNLPFLKDELIGFISQSKNDLLIQEWSEVNKMTVDALEGFISKLETEYLPNSKPEFAIGKKNILTF